MMKKVMAVIITICIVILNNSVLAFGSTSFSNEKVFDTTKISCNELHDIDIDSYEYIKTPDGKYINVCDLKSFESVDDAKEYVTALLWGNDGSGKSLLNKHRTMSILQNGTSGTALVDSQSVSFAASINLYVSFTTSYPNNTGVVTSHSAYTSFTGFTYSFGWEENYCTSYLSSNKKDIYASASGELIFYFLINGLMEIYREEINLSGMCMAVH